MKSAKLLCTGVFAATIAAAGMTARADVITLDVSATETAVSGGAACTGTCTLGGHFVIDNTAGTVLSGSGDLNITASGFSPSVGAFTTNNSIASSGGLTVLHFTDSAVDDELILEFSTPTPGSLVGYTGGSLVPPSIVSELEGNNLPTWKLSTGTLTAEKAAVPAPLIGRGLPVALAFGIILFATKLLQRSRKPRSPGTQPA
jgi:hypothetical protein